MPTLATALADFRVAQAAMVDAAERVRVAAEAEGDLGIGKNPEDICAVLGIVAEHYGYSLRMFQARDKTARVVLARQVAMWLCKKYTKHSSVFIGTVFLRDHGTVLWAITAINDRMGTDARFLRELIQLRATVETALAK